MFLLSDLQGGMTQDLQTPEETCPPTTSQKPVSKTTKNLSPIQETSVEANSLTSLGGLSAGNCSPLQEDQDQEEMDHVPSPGELSEASLKSEPTSASDTDSPFRSGPQGPPHLAGGGGQ